MDRRDGRAFVVADVPGDYVSSPAGADGGGDVGFGFGVVVAPENFGGGLGVFGVVVVYVEGHGDGLLVCAVDVAGVPDAV